MFKRRLLKRTDYKQRLALLKSGSARVVIRKSLSNTHVQVIRYQRDGDEVVTETLSKELEKHGWKGHGANMSSAYPTGLLAGIKAKKHGVTNVVVDLGL